jgi:hypothetical protein
MNDNENNKTLVKLINPKFTLQFADNEYQVRKASMAQVIQFEKRMDELSNSSDAQLTIRDRDFALLAYCIFLLLKEVDLSVTEQFVKDNLPGDINELDVLGQLGFINPQKLKAIKEAQEKLIIQNSSPTLVIEPDGLPIKSAN